jgi:hypothetical protein
MSLTLPGIPWGRWLRTSVEIASGVTNGIALLIASTPWRPHAGLRRVAG